MVTTGEIGLVLCLTEVCVCVCVCVKRIGIQKSLWFSLGPEISSGGFHVF
jgi:hypothetical protein